MRSTLTARVAPLILAVSLAVTALPHPLLAAMAAHRDGGVLLPLRAASNASPHDRNHSPLYSPRLAAPRLGRAHPNHLRLQRSRRPWQGQHHRRLRHPLLKQPRLRHPLLKQPRLRHHALGSRSQTGELRLTQPRLGRAHYNQPRLHRTRAVQARQSHRDSARPRLSRRVVTASPTLPYMAAKIEMLALINAERAQAGARPLSFDPILNSVAQWRSQDMITRHYFSHQIPPSGHYVFDTLDRDHVLYEMAGENIALNNYIDFYSLDRTVRQTNTDLMNSPDHRANILEPKYTKIGLGMAFERGTGKLILTEVFVQP